MAQIPRYSTQQVQANGLPNIQQSDHGASPEAFGAGIGRGLQGFAQVATQLADQEREKADTAALMEAQKALSDLDMSLLNDPEHGAFAKQGKDAIGIHEQVLPEWDRRASQVIGQAPPRIQARVQQYAMQRRESAAGRLMSHSLEQGDRYYAERADSTMKLFQSEAVTNRLDPEAVDKAAGQAMQAADELGRLKGLSDEGRNLLRREAASTAYRGTIEALAQDNPLEAEKRFEKVRELMSPNDQLDLDKQLRPLTQDREDMADFQQLMGGIGPTRQIYDGPAAQVEAGTQLQALSIEQRRALPYKAQELDAYAAYVEQQYDLPRGLIVSIKNAGERSNSDQVSPAGARGVMQFMPQNLRKYGVTDPTDPVQMIEAAGKYLRDGMRQYGGDIDKVIADYNGGPRQANRAHGSRVQETRDYVDRVKGAMGAVDTAGQSQAVAVKPPASEVETMRLIDERYRDNPLKRERMRRVAEREWGMRGKERAERDRRMAESIFQAIYEGDPRQPLASKLSAEQRRWATDTGRLDAFEAELTRRATGMLKKSDPVLVEALSREAVLSPDTFANRDILKNVEQLGTDDLTRLMKLQADLRDPSKKSSAQADWATEGQRIDRGAAILGFDKKGKEADKQAFAAWYRLAEQSFIQQHGKKPDGAQADAFIRGAVQQFLSSPERTSRIQRLEKIAMGIPVEGLPVLSADERKQIVQDFREQHDGRQPTEAELLRTFARHNTPKAE